MTEPQRACPRWERCAVNVCPLDPEQDRRQSIPEDRERKCGMAKSIRVRIGSKYPDLLPRGGLTAKEYATTQRWANLGENEREERKARLRTLLSRINPVTPIEIPKTHP